MDVVKPGDKAIDFCLDFDPKAKPKLAKILEGVDYRNLKIPQDPELMKLALQEMIEYHKTHGHPGIEGLLKNLDQQSQKRIVQPPPSFEPKVSHPKIVSGIVYPDSAE